MSNYIFYSHAGSGNHGCEAIVRSSINMLDKGVKLFSLNPDQDKQYGIGNIVDAIYKDSDKTLQRYSFPWLFSRIQTKLTHSIDKEIFYRKIDMLSQVKPGDIWFSIGGDNYCYPGTDILAAERNNIQSKGGRTVLWGCSVEPELLQNQEVANDLGSYDLITARESISYNALKTVNKNTILVSDPAFTLPSLELPLPEGWIPDRMIGINVSPLVLNWTNNKDLVYKSFYNLINWILSNTDFSIVLIPHVVWNNSDDREPLKHLWTDFFNTERIILLPDYNCMELKGFISRCRMFIGARTHATIAAYSSKVPTLVLGYSVKSRGIAKDIFGNDNNYVLPVQSLNNVYELTDTFKNMMRQEHNIRMQLENKMDTYITNAFLASEAITRI